MKLSSFLLLRRQLLWMVRKCSFNLNFIIFGENTIKKHARKFPSIKNSFSFTPLGEWKHDEVNHRSTISPNDKSCMGERKRGQILWRTFFMYTFLCVIFSQWCAALSRTSPSSSERFYSHIPWVLSLCLMCVCEKAENKKKFFSFEKAEFSSCFFSELLSVCAHNWKVQG